ncbi:tyrosine-type recombinase/integrase [Sphingomonas naphthae]|uniref:Tyrosine-type recombinase/integrase n=1 Tax=Sphingomonas naphthae TaxID=1813468 RepID=A0ABY7TQW7_9SPHN|nr:tyrosine-type recombinase/integrase [Sphingomonas naphthae]WCT75381.1 tyrosine-type recombinase/integrase [Sphingomonas naphthae]
MYEASDGSLFDAQGQRKYLVPAEAKRFLSAAAQADAPTKLFAQLLYLTGCRLSEGLALTPRLIDAEGRRVVFRTLKRRKLTHRAVPAPAAFMRDLLAHADSHGLDDRLFPWCRQTGWRRIRTLMDKAGIEGPQASPKGLRHQFGVHAIGQKIPESAVGRWLGHASGKSTRVYTFVVGAEERALAERMWRIDR